MTAALIIGGLLLTVQMILNHRRSGRVAHELAALKKLVLGEKANELLQTLDYGRDAWVDRLQAGLDRVPSAAAKYRPGGPLA